MTSLYITGAGLVTALGLDLDRTIASLRSGLDALQCMPFVGRSGKELQGAPICGFGEAVGGIDRFEMLARRAIDACMAGLDRAGRERTAICLGLPRPGRPGVPAHLAQELQHRLATALDMPASSIIPIQHGRVSAYAALTQARQLLADGGVRACVLGGVDVLTNGASLKGLSQAGLLKEDWDGFIPGEAAAFIKVQSTPAAGIWRGWACSVAGLGAATESAAGTAADPLTGRAVCAAFRSAVEDAGAAETDLGLYINDVSGGRVAFEDNAMGRTRFFRAPHHTYEVWHVASWLGETGAAVGALQLAWGAAALELGLSPSSSVLVSGSEGTVRAAAILRAPAVIGLPAAARRAAGHGQPTLHVPTDLQPMPVQRDPGLALPADGMHAALAWRNLEELAWLWGVREHHHQESTDPWTAVESYEARLITHLDALSWQDKPGSAGVLQALSAEEPTEIAAAMLVLLSFPLESAMARQVLEAATSSSRHREMLTKVCPHLPHEVGLPIALRMAASQDGVFCQAGLRVMAATSWADEHALRMPLASADSGTVTLAIQAAGAAGLAGLAESAAARAASLPQLLEGGLTKVALLSLGLTARDLPQLEVSHMVRDTPVAAALLCLREGTPLEPHVPAQPLSAAWLEACGWSGEVQLTARLLEALDDQNPSRGTAAALALQRIYGITCEPASRADPQAMHAQADSAAAPEPPLSLDRRAWESAIAAKDGSDLRRSGSQRLRHGKPWSCDSSITHMLRPDCNCQERLIAAWEYAVVHRRGLPVHPGRFVAVQRAALQRLGPGSGA